MKYLCVFAYGEHDKNNCSATISSASRAHTHRHNQQRRRHANVEVTGKHSAIVSKSPFLILSLVLRIFGWLILITPPVNAQKLRE